MQKIGYGATSEVYDIGENKVLKLYYDCYDSGFRDLEFDNAALVQQIFNKTVRVFVKSDSKNRYGIVFEKIYGESLAKYLHRKPWEFIKIARDFAHLHYSLHTTSCTGLPSQKIKMKDVINLKDIPDENKALMMEWLDNFPNDEKICHNDFSLRNIMLSNKEVCVIDWLHATKGDPAEDVANTILNLKTKPDSILYNSVFITLFRSIYLNTFCFFYKFYYCKMSKMSLKRIESWTKFLLYSDLVLNS